MDNLEKILIINLNINEKKIINNIFNNIFNYFNIKIIIDISNISTDFQLEINTTYIYIYDKSLKTNNILLYNNSIIKYEINNIINIDNIIDILNKLEYNFNYYYHIYNECIVSNSYYLKNINHNEYKSPYLFNSFRIFDINGKYIYNQSYVEQEQNISINYSINKCDETYFVLSH
jgi:hypothetical protein